jgi:hypothetical protein
MNATSNRVRTWGLTWPLGMAIFATLAGVAWGQTSTITRIEEDWEMVIGVPSENSDAPQVICLISPSANADGLHATFVLNHHDVPSFAAGGLQLQVWNGDSLLVGKRSPTQAVLASPGETIQWTQALSVSQDGLVFEVIHGRSTTWGNFGDDGTLKAVIQSQLTNLSGYTPENSAKESGVSYAPNRVQSLVLKRVRIYTAQGQVMEDTNPRVVHAIAE